MRVIEEAALIVAESVRAPALMLTVLAKIGVASDKSPGWLIVNVLNGFAEDIVGIAKLEELNNPVVVA